MLQEAQAQAQTQKTRLTQLQEDRILFEDIILRTMSSAMKYVHGDAREYEKWDELETGGTKGVYELRKEFLKKLRYAISGYFDDFKTEHPDQDVEYNIVKKKKLIEDLNKLKNIIKTQFPKYADDCVYYDKFIDLIKGKKVTNLTEMDIYKFGKTTMPSNVDANYMSHLGHEIIKGNETANKTEAQLFEEAENNGGRTKEI